MVQADLDALPESYRTKDVDALIMRYVKNNADVSALRGDVFCNAARKRLERYVSGGCADFDAGVCIGGHTENDFDVNKRPKNAFTVGSVFWCTSISNGSPYNLGKPAKGKYIASLYFSGTCISTVLLLTYSITGS